MQSLSNILKNRIPQSSVARGVSAAQTVEISNKILTDMFGDPVREHAQVVHVKDKILSIACLSPVVAAEIKLREPQFRQLLHEHLPPGSIVKISYIL